mgnify:CR=1 FL=1
MSFIVLFKYPYTPPRELCCCFFAIAAILQLSSSSDRVRICRQTRLGGTIANFTERQPDNVSKDAHQIASRRTSGWY